jgi:hypothetical protein
VAVSHHSQRGVGVGGSLDEGEGNRAILVMVGGGRDNPDFDIAQHDRITWFSEF